MGIPSKWGYHPLLVGGKNSWISGLEVCMAADSPLANPQDLSTQIIRAADEVSWQNQWDGEGVPTRAVHPESLGFPTENGEIFSIFFWSPKPLKVCKNWGTGATDFFPNLGDFSAVQRRVQWVQKWQVFAVIFIAEMVIKLIALGLIWGPGALTCPDDSDEIILDMTSRCFTKSLGCQVKNCICLITIWILSIPSDGRTCQ